MAKKSFQAAPKPVSQQPSNADIEAFERGGAGKDKNPQSHKPTFKEKKITATKRLSIDLPAEMHTRFKTVCSANGLKMTKEIEQFIEARCNELDMK